MTGRPKLIPAEQRRQLAQLVQLANDRAILDIELSRLVVQLRTKPATSWADIGAALGVSPQAAQQRYKSIAPAERHSRPRSA